MRDSSNADYRIIGSVVVPPPLQTTIGYSRKRQGMKMDNAEPYVPIPVFLRSLRQTARELSQLVSAAGLELPSGRKVDRQVRLQVMIPATYSQIPVHLVARKPESTANPELIPAEGALEKSPEIVQSLTKKEFEQLVPVADALTRSAVSAESLIDFLNQSVKPLDRAKTLKVLTTTAQTFRVGNEQLKRVGPRIKEAKAPSAGIYDVELVVAAFTTFPSESVTCRLCKTSDPFLESLRRMGADVSLQLSGAWRAAVCVFAGSGVNMALRAQVVIEIMAEGLHVLCLPRTLIGDSRQRDAVMKQISTVSDLFELS